MTRRDAAFIAIIFFSALGALFFGFLKPRPLEPMEKSALEERAAFAEETLAEIRRVQEKYKEEVEYSENLRINNMEAPPAPAKPDTETLDMRRLQALRELLKVRSELIDRSVAGMFYFLVPFFLVGWIGARYLAGDLGIQRGRVSSTRLDHDLMAKAIAQANANPEKRAQPEAKEPASVYAGDPYKALGLIESAEEEEVRERYRKRLEAVGGPQVLMSAGEFDHPGKDYAIKLNSAYKEVCRRRGWAP